MTQPDAIKTLSQQWFNEVVLGLNLCPFAHRPARAGQIYFSVSQAIDESSLLDELLQEIEQLAQADRNLRETTLLIVPQLLADFYDYQFFLEEANRKLKYHQWQGVFQLASFHPDYCFAGTSADDASNLTNRSPLPIIHILREDSLSEVLAQIENPEAIPENNIKTMSNLSEAEKKKLFRFLYNR